MKVRVLGFGWPLAGCSYRSHYKGYLNNPSATASAITPDGWFKTGDIATSDAEGFLTIIDRRKELIKYKVGVYSLPSAVFTLTCLAAFFSIGLPRQVGLCIVHASFLLMQVGYGAVPPAELEALLLQHPDVADAAVVGVYSKQEATELPRYAEYPFRMSSTPLKHAPIFGYTGHTSYPHVPLRRKRAPNWHSRFRRGSLVGWRRTRDYGVV